MVKKKIQCAISTLHGLWGLHAYIDQEMCGSYPCLWGGGWVGSWLAPEAGSHGQCVLPSLARLGPTRLSGLIAPQPVDDPRTPPRCWWKGGATVPVCISRMLWGAVRGFLALDQGTVAHLCSPPAGCGPPVGMWGGGGGVCARCSGPRQRGQGSPTLRLLESLWVG